MSGPAGPARGARDWHAWYEAYDDPTSSQSRRLAVVQRRIGEALDRLGAEPVRVLSLCAGDGRDVLQVLATRRSREVSVVLVERDPVLAARAVERGDASVRDVEVRVADAGASSSFADVVPVDLLLLCGIFGNVADEDILRTIAAVPAMVRPRGEVIWTRGRFGEHDLRPAVRRWFREAGLVEVAFDGDPERFGVGVARRPDGLAVGAPPAQLFAFDTGAAGVTSSA